MLPNMFDWHFFLELDLDTDQHFPTVISHFSARFSKVLCPARGKDEVSDKLDTCVLPRSSSHLFVHFKSTYDPAVVGEPQFLVA